MDRIKSGIESKTAFDILKYFAVIGIICWMIIQGIEKLGYHWQWYRAPRYIGRFEDSRFIAGPLINGLGVTGLVSFISLFFMTIIGLASAILNVSASLFAKLLSRCYIECIRNTPLLVQILFMYFVLSPILGVNRFASAVIALSLFEGAYASEIFRSGIVSIHRGQWEAAMSLGMTLFQTYRCIILPQAVRRVLPPLVSQAISLVKDSSLVSVIAIYDLTMQGQVIIAETFLTFELWFTVALLYLMITLTLSVVVRILEKRFKRRVS